MDQLKQKWQNQITRRLRFFTVILGLVVCAIFARLIHLQFYDERVADNSVEVHKRLISTDTLYATRGSILARDGSTLATSILRRSIYFDFGSHGCDNDKAFAKNADSLSKMLSAYFGNHSAQWYYNRMDSIRNAARTQKIVGYKAEEDERSLFMQWISPRKQADSVPVYATVRRHTYTRMFRDIDQNEWEQIRHFPILNGSLGAVLHKQYIDTRIYPHGNLARRIIGRADNNFRQHFGIEYAYRDTLASHKGWEYRQYMAPNFAPRIENDTLKTVPAVAGADIHTTLDIELQDVADRALRKALQEQGGDWGTTVVMECSTGDILAMVNLTRASEGVYLEGTNHALGTTIEPGSTIKLATTMILLDKAGLATDKKYNSGYGRTITVGKNKVSDSHPIGTRRDPRIDLKTAFTESANVYFVKAVKEHFDHREAEYYNALCSLELHRHSSLTEFQPPKPLIPQPKSSHWSALTLGLLSYGYGLEITPLQTLTLYNAVANGGTMVAPRLITHITRDGNIVSQTPVKVVKQSICSPTTLAFVRECLESVAEEGTASEYFASDIVPFSVGAKTGTATIAKGHKYSENYHLGSMVTYMPADKPKYTFITAIYKRKGKGSIFGAALAGPVQQKIATYLHNRDLGGAERLVVSDIKQLPNDVKGGNIEHICRVTSQFNIAAAYTSPTGWGTTTTGISSVTIASTAPDTKRVPSVMGMGLSDAIYLLESRGLKVRFSGAGKVVYQSKEAGTAIEKNQTITIKLE